MREKIFVREKIMFWKLVEVDRRLFKKQLNFKNDVLI